MTIAEANRFYATDKQEYQVDKNREFLTWFYDKLKQGYTPYLNLKEINELIQKIRMWYELKYPNRELELHDGVTDTNFEGINNISDQMNFEQLRYRLTHAELHTLDCEYRSTSGYCRPNWGGQDELVSNGNGWIDYIGFKVSATTSNEMKVIRLMSATAIGGFISPYELAYLDGFLTTPTDYITIKDLIKMIKNSTNMESPDLERIEFTYETDLELRKRIIDMVNLALIYSKETIPEYGIERAHRLAEEVSQKYNISIETPRVEELKSHSVEPIGKLESLKISNLKRKVKKLEKKNN